MKRLKAISITSLIAASVALIIRSLPATLRSVRVTSMSYHPATAHIALLYGQGNRPQSLICDLYQATGMHLGSITLNGTTLYSEIPLAKLPEGNLQINIQAYYRLFGRVVRIAKSF